MTLTTEIRIEAETLNPEEFFKKLSAYAECPESVNPIIEKTNDQIRLRNPFGVGAKLWVQLITSPHPIKDYSELSGSPLFNKCRTIITVDTNSHGGSRRTGVFIDRLTKEHPYLKFFVENELNEEWFENQNPFYEATLD